MVSGGDGAGGWRRRRGHRVVGEADRVLRPVHDLPAKAIAMMTCRTPPPATARSPPAVAHTASTSNCTLSACRGAHGERPGSDKRGCSGGGGCGGGPRTRVGQAIRLASAMQTSPSLSDRIRSHASVQASHIGCSRSWSNQRACHTRAAPRKGRRCQRRSRWHAGCAATHSIDRPVGVKHALRPARLDVSCSGDTMIQRQKSQQLRQRGRQIYRAKRSEAAACSARYFSKASPSSGVK